MSFEAYNMEGKNRALGEANSEIERLEEMCGALKFELANALEYARQTMPPTEFDEAMALVRSTPPSGESR